MIDKMKIEDLRKVITENLRIQRDTDPIDYIDVANALNDTCSRQNHTIFARRGCGKTLLLHHSRRKLPSELKCIYLNCEDFKKHTFPNVLIEILVALFSEMEKNLPGWFGRKKKSRDILKGIVNRLKEIQKLADIQEEEIKRTLTQENKVSADAALTLRANVAEAKIGAGLAGREQEGIETSFKVRREKLQELDRWLPDLKSQIRNFFELSKNVKGIFLQIDDLYHLKRTDQAFVVDYIHRLCKDVPLYFKIATLRHASTLYVDRDGQPIGAQERHDYQPINIDYTFRDFKKTERQNWQILEEFGKRVCVTKSELQSLFKGEGFERLVMAGGGVPRDVLSLFLEVLGEREKPGEDRIGKDEVRILSRSNFERRIEELKQDSQGDEQDALLKGIYILREFCLEKKTNVFNIREQFLQQNDEWRSLIYRLMDYRIIHSAGSALTHKSQGGTYQAFAIDIGCYAHLRKLQSRFNEIDVADSDAKEKMRSSPILDQADLEGISRNLPANVEAALTAEDEKA